MSDKADKQRSRKAVRKSRASKVGKVATDADGKVMTQEQLRRFADNSVDEVNLRVDKAGTELNGAADYLFKGCFVADVEAALALAADSRTPQYDILRARAGKSLTLKPSQLRCYVRIGALNQHSRAKAWKKLDMGVKIELLPLVNVFKELPSGEEGDRDFSLFNQGVKYANQPNVGVMAVREWVQRELPHDDESAGRPRGMTMAAGNTFLKTGVKLGQPTQRKRLASSVNAASPEKRKAFAKDLKATIENLQGLLGDLDDNDDNDDNDD